MDAPQLWAAYVRVVVDTATPGADQTTIAKRAGTTQGTISRWLGGRYLPDKAAPVALFAQRYDRHVLEAFVAAGMITEQQAAEGLPSDSHFFLMRVAEVARAEIGVSSPLSYEPDELRPVADNSHIEGSGDHTP